MDSFVGANDSAVDANHNASAEIFLCCSIFLFLLFEGFGVKYCSGTEKLFILWIYGPVQRYCGKEPKRRSAYNI